jgi:uncharacterized membrane protein
MYATFLNHDLIMLFSVGDQLYQMDFNDMLEDIKK